MSHFLITFFCSFLIRSQGVTPLVRQVRRSLQEEEGADGDEELPWCVICNEDAKLRCVDCDNDLYCKGCFGECHTEFDMKHEAVEYKKGMKKNKC